MSKPRQSCGTCKHRHQSYCVAFLPIKLPFWLEIASPRDRFVSREEGANCEAFERRAKTRKGTP